MSDDAAVTFGMPVGPGALSFTDAGFMPIRRNTSCDIPAFEQHLA